MLWEWGGMVFTVGNFDEPRKKFAPVFQELFYG